MKFHHHLIAILVVLLWGLDFVAAKIALAVFPPFFLLSLRFGMAALLLTPFLRRPPMKFTKLLLIAFSLAILHVAMIFLSIRMGLNASVVAVATQMRVPFALLLSVIFLREVIRWRSISGISIAILGTLILVGSPNVLSNYWAFLVALGGAMGWAIYNTLLKGAPRVNYFSFMVWIAFLAAPMLFMLSLLSEAQPWEKFTSMPWQAWAAFIYLIVFSTILSHGAWYKLLHTYELNQVVPYTLLVPVFGVSAASIFLHEAITWEVFAGGFLTLLGVSVVVWRRPKMVSTGKGL